MFSYKDAPNGLPFCCFKLILFLFWYDFQPVVIGVIDEINTHFWIFKTDAAHFFVFFMSSVVICNGKSQMEFVFAQVIRFFSVTKPCQFQLKICHAIAQINQFPAAVRGFFPAYFRSRTL